MILIAEDKAQDEIMANEFSVSEDDQLLAFVNEWMSSIVDYEMGTLTVQLCGVPKYSNFGKEQLRVDLEYLR